jgi:N12 class adenine-specific DNA methylase/DNA repair protein RadC
MAAPLPPNTRPVNANGQTLAPTLSLTPTPAPAPDPATIAPPRPQFVGPTTPKAPPSTRAGDLDYGAFTTPSLAKSFAPQARAQQSEAAAAQREQERQQNEIQKANEAAAKANAERAKRDANNAAEATFRQSDRPHYTDADGIIRPTQDDQTWAAEQQAKQENAQQQVAWKKAERPTWKNPVSNQVEPIDDDETWAAKQATAAAKRTEDLRRKVIDDEIAKAQIHGADPARATLNATARTKIEKALKDEQEIARASLITRHSTTAKAVTGGNDWIPFNEAPAPEAQTAKARLDALNSNFDGDLSEEDLADLEADPTTAPRAAKLRALQARLAQDDENTAFQQTNAEREFDLKLKRTDPAAWAARRQQRLDGLAPADHAKALEAEAGDFTARVQQHEQEAAPLIAQQQQYATQLADLETQAAAARQKGIPAGDLITLTGPDGPQDWPKSLAETYLRTQQQAETWQADNRDSLDLLQTRQNELQVEQEALVASEAQAQEKAKAQRAADLARLTQSPITRPLGEGMTALEAEAEQRRAALTAKFPDPESPQAKEALAALETDLQTKSAALQEDATFRQTTAQQAYAGVKERMAADPENPNIGQHFVEARQNLVDLLGVTPKEADTILDDQMKGDWSLTNVPDRSLEKYLQDGGKLKEPVRILSSGDVVLNPELLANEQASREAIAAAPTSAAAKARALEILPTLRAKWAEAMLPAFTDKSTPFFLDFNEWREAKVEKGGAFNRLKPSEQLMQYLDEREADHPAAKLGRHIGTGLYAGFMDIATQGLSLAAMGANYIPTGLGPALSEELSSLATANQANSQAVTQTAAFDQAGLITRGLGQAARISPSLVPSLAGGAVAQGALIAATRTAAGRSAVAGILAATSKAKDAKSAFTALQTTTGLVGAGAAGAAQTAGAQYADIYGELRGQGMTHKDAHTAALTPALLSGAATAILTVAFGATGAEKLLEAGAQQAVKNRFTNFLKEAGKGFFAEQPEELLDEMFSTVVSDLAKNPNKPVTQSITEFIETIPELAIAIGLMGGAGAGIAALRAPAAPKTSPEAAAQAPDPTKLPEVLAAARAAITGYQPAAGSLLTPQAATAALEVAQGNFAKLTTSQLESLGWTRENGKLKPLKNYAGPPALEFTDKEQTTPILRQELLDEIDAALPEVGDAIALDEAEAREYFQQQQQNAAASAEAPAPGLATNVSGAAAPATATASPPADTAPPPATEQPAPADPQASPTLDQFTPAEAERTEQITNHLTALGLDQVAAEKVAAHMVRVQGVMGEDYRFNVVADSFKAELKKLGITGALTRVGAQTNPLKAPADLDARLSPVAPAGAVAAPANAPAVEAPAEPRGDSAQGAAAPAESGVDTPQGGAEATPAEAPPAPVSRHSPNSRAGKLAAMLVADGSYTQQEADEALDDYMAARPRGTEKMTVIEEKKPLLKFLADRENRQNGGKLKRAQATATNPSSTEQGSPTEKGMEKAQAAAVAAQPVGSRRRARRAMIAMNQALKKWGQAFDRIDISAGAKQRLAGGAMAVDTAADGATVLLVDLDEFATQHSWSATSRLLSADTLSEEIIHALAKNLAKNDKSFSDTALAKLWDDLTPKIRQTVWDAYNARALSDDPEFPRNPPAGAPVRDKATLTHEFLRMLVQKKAFTKRVTEEYGIDPRGILDRIAALLKKLSTALQDAIKGAPKDLQTQIETYQTKLLSAAEQLEGSPNSDKNAAQGSPNSTNSASKGAVTSEDNRAPVVIAGSPAPTASGPKSLTTGAKGTAYTDTNDAIDYEWAVVETNELTISNRDDGTVDPAYPQELQPRDRTSAGSEAQVQDIAKNANLDRLSATNTVGDGAPIIGPDGVVESGNGRTMGIRRAYTRGLDSAAKYKQRLQDTAGSYGLTGEAVAKMKAPMLVRVRTTNVDRVAFVMAANVSTIAPKREIEQAKTDAKQIVPDLFETFVATEEGDIFTAANADFIRGFIAAVVPPAERPAIYDAKGFLSQTGLRRIRNALFVYAYGDSKSTLNALARLTEDIEADGRNLINALIALAPRFGEQNARIAAGALRPLSITADLAEALAAYQGIKERGETVENWAAQTTLPGVDDGPTDLQKALVTTLHENRRSARKLMAVLNRYAAGIETLGDPKQASLFGEEPTPTQLELWDIASKAEPAAPLATAQRTRSPNDEVVNFTPAGLAARINRDSFMGPNWYASTVKKLRAALDFGWPIEIQAIEVSDYGGKLNAIIRGEVMPLTRGKVRHSDIGFHFGPQTRQKVSMENPTPPATPSAVIGNNAATNNSSSIAPNNALKLYRKLKQIERDNGTLSGTQAQTLRRAEASLGQSFFPFETEAGAATADFSLETESTTAGGNQAAPPEEQLKLFMATKKSLYSKAAKEKHLRPIIRSLVQGVQDSLIRVVQETVIPQIPPRLRAIMDQASADYNAWLEPRMADLKPQWEAYKARYTPAIVDAYNDKLEAIAAELGVMPMTRVPLKGDRGMEKAILDAEDDSVNGVAPPADVTTVNDVLRASLVANDDEGVARIVEAIRSKFKVVYSKDRFTKPVGGYHDWLFTVEVAPGLNAEVQVHRIDYLFSKEIGPGHLMYEDWRRLNRLVKLNPAPELAQLFRRLSKAMEGYYTAIAQAFNISRNAASSISTPSLSNRAPSAIGRGAGDPRQVIGTGGLPSMSQVAGLPFTSKNFVVGGNVSGIFTTEDTTDSLDNQAVRITTANISAYAGNVDTTALQGRQKDWKQAFDWQPGVPVVPLSKLVSPKNELEDPKFKAGLKKDPRQNAADWILKAMQGEPGAKKRAPLDVSANPDGTYTIIDGNATAQALMLAGWKAVPVMVRPAPLAMARKTRDTGSADLFSFDFGGSQSTTTTTRPAPDLGFTSLLTPAQQEAKLTQAEQLDLFGTAKVTTPPNSNDDRRTKTPSRRPDTSGTQRSEAGSVLGDLFDIVAGQRKAERDPGLAGKTEGDLFAPPGQQGVESGAGSGDGPRGGSRSPEGDLPNVGQLPNAGGGDRPGRGDGKGATPGVDRPRKKSPPERTPAVKQRPAKGSPGRNIAFTRDAELSPRGLRSKLKANLEALRIVKAVETEGRLATAEEKQALIKFSGWGALSQAFDDDKAIDVERGEIESLRANAEQNRRASEYRIASKDYYLGQAEIQEDDARKLENWKKQWNDAHQQIKAALSDQEYRAAKRSTINAHFTAPDYIGAMWDMAEWLGFKGGNVLEPGAGIGHFFGIMPENLADRSNLFGVELDAYTAKILAILYPEADIQNTGFQTADIADNSIDLGISNVPFANVPVVDKALEAMGGPVENLHDYFFGKALTKLKPGGVQIFITSAFTMDKGNPEIRKWLAERADLVAAFRLPNDAFKENAGTDVVTDIIVLRKKDGKPFPHAQDWSSLGDSVTRKGEPIRINQYFAAHPQNILGLLDNDGSMFAARDGETDKKEMTVHSDPNRPARVMLQQAIASLPRDIFGSDGTQSQARVGLSAVKAGNIVARDGKFYFQGTETPDKDLNDPKNASRVKAYIAVRDALNTQYDLELSEDATPEDIETNRFRLNATYDSFVSRFENFHNKKNKNLLLDDPDYFRLLGAEVESNRDKGAAAAILEMVKRAAGKRTYVKADIFKRRVLEPRFEPTQADSLEDAFGISLGWRGRVDIGFMASLLGETPDQVERALIGREIAVRDPSTGQILSREQYLAGNVRKKLEIAQASGPEYRRNVQLLETVQPQDIGIQDIRFKIGATWIPPQMYSDFLSSLGVQNVKLTYTTTKNGEGSDRWEIDDKKVRWNGVAYKDFETRHIDILAIMDSLLNFNKIAIYQKAKDGKRILLDEATAQAKETAKNLNAKFIEWARSNADTGTAMAQIYNKEANGHAQRTYDGQFLTFPWANKDFEIFPDKKNTIWRAIQEGFGLIAHGVGGGKTIIGSAIALEMRRLGMARKPMIVVHNSTLEGFAKELAQMAPAARVLVGRKDELQGEKRKEFLMRIAAGDWDAIVIAHSTFGMIADDPMVEIQTRQNVVDEMVESLKESGYDSVEAAKTDRQKSSTVKNLIKQIERMEAAIEKASKRTVDEGLLNFQQLGIDALIVDEIHEFKKMPFSTKQDAKGVDGTFSEKGYALMMRARQIQSKMGGKNIFTMTGTPVTNTLGEIWNMVRLVAPHLMKEYKIEHFDQFVSKFAEVETVSEMGPTGEFKLVDRLSKVVNLPEWATFLRMAADVKLGDALVVKNRPGIKGGKPELVAVPRSAGVSQWVSYIRDVLGEFATLTGKDLAADPRLTAVPVQAYMASRAAAIDIRLIEPRAKDEPDSKVNVMLDRLMGIYERTTPYNGTQVIFADSFNQQKISLFDSLMSSESIGIELDPTKGAGTTFNLYEDIRAKLIDRGVPAEQIAVITDSKWNDAKRKQALFEMVNEGKVRIIIGSTQRLGTGVNMQKRMAAGHHLDVPWTPAGLEQRDGRVFRQGNIHGEMGVEIELIRYGMKDTLDAALWQKLETKQRFITLSLSGKIVGRELEEVDEIMTLAEQRAVLSGPYGQEIFELETRLKELEAARNGHFNEADSRASEIAGAKSYLGILTAQNARLEPSIAKMQRLGVTVQTDGVKIAIDGETFDTKAATNEALDALMQNRRDAFELSQDGQKSTASDIASITVNGIPVYLNSSASFSYEFDQATQRQITIPKIKWHLLSSPSDANEDITFGTVGSAGTLFARLEELSESVDSLRSVMAANASRTKQLSEMAPTGAWPLQAEYDETLAKLQAVKDKLSGSPEAATAPAALLEPYYPSASTYYPAMPLAMARKTYAPKWPATFPNVRVHTTIAALKAHPAYEKAKEGNTLAAIAVVQKFAKPDVLRAISAQYPDAIWVGVHAEEKRGRNKLPNALAQYAAALTGTEADSLIVQSTKTHRTGELSDYRLQNLPEFDGLVVRGAKYILVDDVVTMGGTLAELRAHIETHGGQVVHMTSLAASQFSAKIALDPKTRLALENKFGDAALREFATNSLQIANWEGITEGEARWILKQPTLERAGNRLTAGGQESINSRLSESLEEEIQQYLDLDNVAVPASQHPAAKRAIRAAEAASTQPYPLPDASGSDRNRDRLGELRDRAQRAWRGLTGLNPEAIAEAFKQSDTISSLLHDFIRQDIPSFDIRGAIITSPEDFAAFNLAVRSPYFESLKIAVIGDGDQVIHSQIVHVGSLNESIADPKRIAAIIASARVANPKQNIRGYLIAHNHPSGDPNPSNADRRITRRFEEVGALLGVPLIDHVVTNGTRYFSFKESGLLQSPAIPTELATPSLSSKPKLPILPTPDAPGAYNLADWEVVPASDPDALRPIANDPDRLNSLISNLATGDPGHLHAIYVDTQLRVRAVERIPETASLAKLIQTLIQGVAREGGYAVALGKSHSSTDPTPSDTTRRIHRTVQQALNAANIEHIDTFITTPTGPYYSFAEQGLAEDPSTYSTSPLAAAPKVSDTSPDDRPSLDPTTGAITRISGSRLTPEQGQAVGHGIASRLKNALREGAPGTPAFDWQSTGLPQRLAAAFNVPILTDDQEARLRSLPVNTDGIESTVYLDRPNGVIYKRLATGTNEPALGIWPDTGWTPDRKLEWHYQQADRPRHLAIRVAVMTALGGTPTEIHAIGPAGHVYLKQPLSPNPGIGRDPNAVDNNVLTIARRRAGIVELPSGLLPASSPRAFVAAVNGRPWLLTDLYPDNFIGDNQGNARVNDPVVGHITPDLLAQVPGLGAIVKQAIAEEQRLGDRSARLFAAPKTTTPEPPEIARRRAAIAELEAEEQAMWDAQTTSRVSTENYASGARYDAIAREERIRQSVMGSARYKEIIAAKNSLYAAIAKLKKQKAPVTSQPLRTATRTQAADYDMVMARYQGQVNLETSKQGRTHSTIVRDLLQRRARGENISPEVLDRAIKTYFPSSRVKTPLSMIELPSQDQVERAITSDKLKNHREAMEKGFPTPGSRVTVRQDVPAWQKGVGVVTTVTNNGTFYLPATRLVDAVFKTNETKTLEIGMGENKGPHIAVIGKWSKDQSMPSDLDTWTQVGFNPDRHSFYYERGTERQVVSAKEIFQVGNTVFAKEPVFEDVRSAITYTAQRTPNPLAKLGWNHLDKSLSAKLAAHTRWMNEKTGAGETVAAWMQSEKVKPFTALGNVLKRELFPDSVLPREITARLREMNIKSSMGAQRAMDLTRALSGTPKFSDIAYPPGFAENPIHRRHLYEAMAGMRNMDSLPQELQDLAKRLRSMLVEIGQEAVKQGRMSLDTFEGLRENYMPHFYEEDVAREKSFLKRFALGIKDIFAQRTTAWHIVDLQTKDKTGEPRLVSHDGNRWRFKNKEHRDAWFEDFIAKESLDRLQSRDKRWRSLTLADLNKRSALPAEARGRLQEIENGLRARYRKEKPLSLAEQEKAGLILDPVYSLARYAAQMVHDNATAEFFNFVASKPEWISDTPTPGFTQLPENTAFGRLSGKHVEDDIYRQLTELVETPNTALRLYDTVLSWWKTGKTVLNPGTHVRNVLGNIPFATFAGTNPLNPGNLGYYRDAIRHLRNGGSTLTEAYEDGVLGADFVSAELRQTLRQLLPDPSTIDESGRGESILLGMGKAIGQVIPSWAKNPTHKAYNQIAALYQAEDEIYKLASYLKARSMGMTREEAAAHTRKWFPYYDLASSATLKLAQRTGMPFLSFYRESIRIFGHAVTERPIALATTLALPSIVTFLSAMALGLDDDELEQIQKDMRGKAGKLLGPTPLGGLPIFSMLLPVRSANGDFQQFDISSIHPFADHLGNRVETDKTEDWWQQTWRSMLTAGPIGNLIYAQVTGRDAFGDRPFVEDNMTTGEKIAARIDNALKTALPPLTPFVGTGAATIANAGSRATNKSLEVRDPVQAVLRAVVGLDVRNANPDIYRIAEDWRKANNIPTTEGMDFSSTTPTSRARKALFTELARPEPKLAAIKNLTAYLEKQGSPVRTADDVRKLLFYRNPLMVIRGQENQQRFRASLTGQERTVLESALTEFDKIAARAPSLILQARAQ